MKRIIFFFSLLLFLSGCLGDDGAQYSAIADFIGEWELEGRVLNDGDPVEIDDESLVFDEDNNFEDLIGVYTLNTDVESSGEFFITGPPFDLNFESTTGEVLTASFNLNDRILRLEYINSDGDTVREVWRKNYYHESE